VTAKKKVSTPASSATPAEPKKVAAPRRRATKTAAPLQAAPESASAVLSNGTVGAVSDEAIRVRAYFLALENGGTGSSFDYWLRAEQELRGSSASRD
jgi:hypothetical protein